MTRVDDLIALVLLGSLVAGAWRGMVREALGLLVWVGATWSAWRFGRQIAQLLGGWIHADAVRLGLAYGAIFIVVLVGGGVVATLASKLLKHTPLSGPDHLFGAGLGLARGLAIATFVLMVAALNGGQHTRWWRESILVPELAPLADLLQAQIPPRWLAPLRLRTHTAVPPEH